MRYRNVFLTVLGVSVVTGIAAAAPRRKPDKPLASRASITAISKVVDGSERKTGDRTFTCPDGKTKTREMSFAIEAGVMPFECDEPCSQQSLSGKFEATARVVRRETEGRSHRGCFAGTWRLKNAAGAVIASGEWSGTVYAGTHNGMGTSCEPCTPQCHFEGVLTGKSTSPQCRGSICTTIQGIGLDPTVPGFGMRVEGSLFGACASTGATEAPGVACGGCGS